MALQMAASRGLITIVAAVRHLARSKYESGATRSGESIATKTIDALAQQVERLQLEMRNMLNTSRSITVVNGQSRGFAIISVPTVVALAVVGYMRWKGYSLGDVMYVTRTHFKAALVSVNSSLEALTTRLNTVRQQLAARLEHLSKRLDSSIEMQCEIKGEVSETKQRVENMAKDLGNVGLDIETVRQLVKSLEHKLGNVDLKQDWANQGISFLCQVASDRVEGSAALQAFPHLQLEGSAQQWAQASSVTTCQGLKSILPAPELPGRHIQHPMLHSRSISMSWCETGRHVRQGLLRAT
eukprot:jgi/Chlat1/4470/Chrsp29S04568